MQVLTRVFTQEISPAIRQQVLEALTAKKLLDHRWIDGDDCCPFAAAAFAAVGEKPSMNRIIGDGKRTVPIVAGMLQISAQLVDLGYREWDDMTDEGRGEFILFMKIELATLKAMARPAVVRFVQDRVTRVAVAVSAIMVISGVL